MAMVIFMPEAMTTNDNLGVITIIVVVVLFARHIHAYLGDLNTVLRCSISACATATLQYVAVSLRLVVMRLEMPPMCTHVNCVNSCLHCGVVPPHVLCGVLCFRKNLDSAGAFIIEPLDFGFVPDYL